LKKSLSVVMNAIESLEGKKNPKTKVKHLDSRGRERKLEGEL